MNDIYNVTMHFVANILDSSQGICNANASEGKLSILVTTMSDDTAWTPWNLETAASTINFQIVLIVEPLEF